ncbi:hypothetical protein CUJ83_10875 [Methanocella sp. CWC-04]|uniref:DUF192 domain-containing protein n=1 Tax=Methanooceanicella nereidis TaxID=2052831 RepID=A0AAP2RFX9_9EURY|nr:DUF192 domain-containing protein [Methanocella sp. CWC-04]MCD1295502.1 hypothetical protein [Methanocella sp. CWC-04]
MKNSLKVIVIAFIGIIILIMAFQFVSYGWESVTPNAVVYTSDNKPVKISLEVADTHEKRMEGLMNRTYLDSDSGMIFVFDYPAKHAFWMKNTLIPLDMIYINDDGTVVDIKYKAVPFDTTPLEPCDECICVIEVNGGFCEEHGIKIGDKVKLILD